MAEADGFTAEIIERSVEPTAAVRIQQPMAELDLAAAFRTSLPLVERTVRDAGGSVTGPSYGRYHQFGPDVVDVEIGFPIAAALPDAAPLASCASGEVGISELPGGPVARTSYVGTYDGLGGVYDRLHEWIHAQPGYDDGAGPWESYVEMPGDHPGSDPRTEISWPLVRE